MQWEVIIPLALLRDTKMPRNILHLAPGWRSSAPLSFSRFIYLFASDFWSAGGNFHLVTGSSKLQSDLVCMGQITVHSLIIWICIRNETALHLKIRPTQTSTKNKTNLLFNPKDPVLLPCCTDPNIMHFPCPENLQRAQQTDKYLIDQPSVPSHPPMAAATAGRAWEYHRKWVPCQSLGIKAHVGGGAKSAPVHLRTPLCGWQLLFACTAQMPGHNRWINTETQNNYKGLLPSP